MSDIVFNPDDMNMGGGYREQPTGSLTKFFMKITGIQNQENVSKVMLIVAICFFALSGIILYLYL